MLHRLTRHRLGVVLALALIVRVGAAIALDDLLAFERTGAIHGSAAYDTYAVNLLATGIYGKSAPGLPDAHLPPLYSYALAGVYALVGRSFAAVAAFNIALDLIAIACLYHLCRLIFPREHDAWVGALAGVFYALYPYLLFQNLTLIDTPLFMALLYAFLLSAAILRARPRLDAWGVAAAIIGGVMLGLLGLARPNAALIAGLVALWFTFRLSVGAAIGRLLPVAAIALIVVAPWLWRCYQLYGEFVPVALNGGENFYQGNNPYTVSYFRAGYDAQWVPIEALPGAPLPVDDPNDPIDQFGPEANAARTAIGWAYLRQNPDAIPDLLWTKFLVHWSIDVAPARNPTEGEAPRPDYRGDVRPATTPDGDLALGGLPPGDPVGAYSSSLFDVIGRTVHRFYFGGLLALALVGYALTARHWRDAGLIGLVQVGMTFTYMLFHPATRYRAPTDPLLFALSAYALVWLFGWVQTRRRLSTASPAPLPEFGEGRGWGDV